MAYFYFRLREIIPCNQSIILLISFLGYAVEGGAQLWIPLLKTNGSEGGWFLFPGQLN